MITDDYQAIEDLHRRDMAAAKDQDYARLRALLTEDFVAIPPEGPIQRGIEAFDSANRTNQEKDIEMEVLEYIEEFEEVEIIGDYAYEWGIIRGQMRINGGDVQDARYRVMRILKKVDGEWKIHRSIWTSNLV